MYVEYSRGEVGLGGVQCCFEGNDFVIRLNHNQQAEAKTFRLTPENMRLDLGLAAVGLSIASVGLLDEVIKKVESYKENGLSPIGFREYACGKLSQGFKEVRAYLGR